MAALGELTGWRLILYLHALTVLSPVGYYDEPTDLGVSCFTESNQTEMCGTACFPRSDAGGLRPKHLEDLLEQSAIFMRFNIKLIVS